MLREGVGYILLIAFTLGTGSLPGQTEKIDSLKQVILKGSKDTGQRATLYDDLAWEYLFINPEEAFPYADSSLSIAREIGDRVKEGIALNTTGVIFLIQQNYDSALVYFQRSVAITGPLNLYLKAGASYSNIGICLYELGQYDSSLVYQNKALEYRALGGDTLEMAKSSINIGAVWDAKGSYLKAIKACLQAIEYLESVEGSSELIATCQSNIGSLHLQLGNYAKSIEYSKLAETVFTNSSSTYRLPMVYNNLGEASIYLEQIDKAIAYFNKAMAINDFDERTLSYSNYGLGQAYLREKDYDLARSYFFKALELDEKNGNLKELASACTGISETYSKQKKYRLAEKYLRKGEMIADSIDALPELTQIKRLSVINQLGRKGLESIYEDFVVYQKLQDSMFSVEKVHKIEEIETQYRTRIIADSLRYEKERNRLVRADFQKEKTIGRLLKALMLVLVSIIGLLWYLFRVKKQQNQQLSSSNQTLLILNKTLSEDLKEKENELLAPGVISNKTITLTSNGKEVLRLGDIICIKSQDKAVQVFTQEKTHWDWVSLKTYNELLPPQLFLKVHRSFIVNILQIKKRTTRTITMNNGITINIGNTIREEVNEFLDEHVVK